jgi:L-lactate dehydrogenase complex protein LldG
MASKDEMLSTIRSALGAGREGTAARPEAVQSPAPGADAGQLAARFADEARKLGATCASVGHHQEIREALETLLETRSITSVAVSDSNIAAKLSLADWVEKKGLVRIPTMREFATRGGSNGDEPPMERYKWELINAGLGITAADYAIADTGTLVLVTGGEQHRLISLVPPVHVCLLDRASIVPDLATLLARIKKEHYTGGTAPHATTFISGTSRTADIELTLTRGVHGPREVHILVYSKDELTGE